MKIDNSQLAHYVHSYIVKLNQSSDWVKKREALLSSEDGLPLLERWEKVFELLPQLYNYDDEQSWHDALSNFIELNLSGEFKKRVQTAFRQQKYKQKHLQKNLNLTSQTHSALQEAAKEHGVTLDKAIFMAVTGRLDSKVTEKLSMVYRRYLD